MYTITMGGVLVGTSSSAVEAIKKMRALGRSIPEPFEIQAHSPEGELIGVLRVVRKVRTAAAA